MHKYEAWMLSQFHYIKLPITATVCTYTVYNACSKSFLKFMLCNGKIRVYCKTNLDDKITSQKVDKTFIIIMCTSKK